MAKPTDDETRIQENPAPSREQWERRARPATLRAEIEQICLAKGRYPSDWTTHTSCPCCAFKSTLFPSFVKYGMRHDQCGNCRFVCLNPYPSDEILRELYSGSYYTLTRELYELPRLLKDGAHTALSAPILTLEKIIEIVAPRSSAGSWLDVGGGLGAFGSLVREKLFAWNVSLNEYNPRSEEIARNIFGLIIAPSNAREIKASGIRYDVISAIAVLEHIADPFQFICDYSGLLRPGGRFVILVPHFTAMCASTARASSPIAAPPFHLSLFNRANLSHLLDRTGLFSGVDVVEDGPAAFSLMQVIDWGNYWDITMPSPDEPAKSIQICEYPPDMGRMIGVLANANEAAGDYFANHDGRVFLTVCATLKEE